MRKLLVHIVVLLLAVPLLWALTEIVTKKFGCGPADYGIYVLMRGNLHSRPPGHYYNSQWSGRTENRALVCIITTGFFTWRACSTHLQNRGTSSQATRMYHANRQAEEAVFISAAGSNLTITGGDFNLTPGELDSFSTWSSLFEEADEYSPFIPTAYGGQNCNSNGRKIDYIWVRDYSVTKLNMTAAFLGCPNDHVYLEENFRITF